VAAAARIDCTLVIVALALPVIVVLSLLLVALFMAPAWWRWSPSDALPISARRGAALWQSVLWSLGCTLLRIAGRCC